MTHQLRPLQRAALAVPVVLCLAGLGQLGAPAASAAVSVNGLTCTVVGTRHSDRLVGTQGRDVICGLGGREVTLEELDEACVALGIGG